MKVGIRITIKEIEKKLYESLRNGEGVRVRATGMGSGIHRYWLTGDRESYQIHCYGRGRGWCDQYDDCNTQDVHQLARYLYTQRKDIIKDPYS